MFQKFSLKGLWSKIRNLQILIQDYTGAKSLSNFDSRTLKSFVQSKKRSFGIDKSELIHLAREALWEEFSTKSLPFLLSVLIITVLSIFLLKKSRYSVKYLVSYGTYQLLRLLYMFVALTAVLSCVQQPSQFPRIVIDKLFRLCTNPFSFTLRQHDVTAWIVDNPWNVNFLPLAVAYLLSRVSLSLQMYMTTIDRYKKNSFRQKTNQPSQHQPVLTEKAVRENRRDDYSADGLILEETGQEGFIQASLDDNSSVVCKKCKQVIARARFVAHSKYWCKFASTILESDESD